MTTAKIASNVAAPADDVAAPRRYRSPRAAFWSDIVSPWPALLVLLAGVMGTLGIWSVLTMWRAAETQRTTDAMADGVRRLIEARVNDKLVALRQLAMVWSREPDPDGPRWKEASNLFLQRHPGIALLAWMEARSGDADAAVDAVRTVRTGEEVHLLVVASADLRDQNTPFLPPVELSSARTAARTVRAATVAGPFAVASGRRMCQVSVPLDEVAGREGHKDMLVALFEPAVLLGEMLTDIAPGHHVRLRNERGTLYEQTRVGAPPDAETTWDVSDEPVRLETGATWSLDLSRNGGADGSIARTVETAVLVIGLAFSALLGVVVYLGQVARVRARALALTNRELQSRVREATAAHDKYRMLNAELEARVSDRTRELDAVVSDLETYNYSISHDLRSPLGAISNYAEVLREDHGPVLQESGRELLGRISRCAGMAASMMDGLLAFSRVGRQEMVLGAVDMRALAESAMAEVSAGRPGPVPELRLGDLPAVRADANMMRVVWTNLLSNAVKSCRDRPDARIEVSAHASGDQVTFQVRDDGRGFDMREAERIFKVFERLPDEDRGTPVPGHGVGLAIVQRIVARHGGRVWAQSAIGKGATFYFSLPGTA